MSREVVNTIMNVTRKAACNASTMLFEMQSAQTVMKSAPSRKSQTENLTAATRSIQATRALQTLNISMNMHLRKSHSRSGEPGFKYEWVRTITSIGEPAGLLRTAGKMWPNARGCTQMHIFTRKLVGQVEVRCRLN